MTNRRGPTGKLVVFSAPSGTGKSTIAKIVLERIPSLSFSVSATTRPMRAGEEDGVQYYFLDKEKFEKKIHDGGFVEHEYFFNNYYGTLLDKTVDAVNSGHHLLFDLDVKGALNLKRLFPDNSLLIFLRPPDMASLRERLLKRESEDADALSIRLERAEYELGYADQFDEVIVNDSLDRAADAVTAKISEFLSNT